MIKRTNYDINNLGTFEQEWLLHRKSQDWWYATGYVDDAEGNRYSYQFTILSLMVKSLNPVSCMIAMTDFQTKEHHYRQDTKILKNLLTVTEDTVAFSDVAKAVRTKTGFDITLKEKFFEAELQMDFGKGAFWHCDNGRLQMGEPTGDLQTTYYYSYTNMPTRGVLKKDGKLIPVTGKSWFDKQGGSFTLNKPQSWEWFSLRFYDDEEIMLFKFPTSGYHDGTYITRDGQRSRLNNYELVTTDYTTAKDSKFSAGWTLKMPGIKEEEYTITPLMDGAINFAYFEELCSIRNKKGEEVGLCFTELWPYIYNDPEGHSAHSNQMTSVEY